MNGTASPARVIGYDEESDLAVLQLQNPPKNLVSLPFGDSADLEVGQRVLAIGNPFGLSSTLTTGIISSLDRTLRAPSGSLMRAWWKIRPKDCDDGVPMPERLLFPGRGEGRPLTTHQLNNIFHKAAKAAGITKAVNLHSLRHSFATHLYDRGLDIRTIQALLGHEKLTTTARYARVATGLISAVESPLDALSRGRKKKITLPKK